MDAKTNHERKQQLNLLALVELEECFIKLAGVAKILQNIHARPQRLDRLESEVKIKPTEKTRKYG